MVKTRRVVILGGGTAGWMTAAYLARMMRDQVEVSVVESETIGTVGVGEATFSSMQLYLECLGLAERDWMPHCNATYKLAIKFVDWNAGRGHFYHPFLRFEMADGRSLAEWWLKDLRAQVPFDYACFTVPTLCDAKRSPRFMDGTVFETGVSDNLGSDRSDRAWLLDELTLQYPYAYHMDAALFGRFLSTYAGNLGVRRIGDNVIDVTRDARGGIAALVTANHGPITGDLFIDCTGFKGLLINQTLEEPFVSFHDSLLCDSALAMQLPVDTKAEGIDPFTMATALSSGWVWRIPLFTRVGTGYVYSSAFISRDEAEREFRRHLGPAADGYPAASIKMRIGRCQRSWVRNCVAIGLSSGFVEPLESTGIFFIQHAIEQLVTHWPRDPQDADIAAAYNEAVANCIDGVRDFLTLHYVASPRSDTPFWKATKTQLTLPPDLAQRMPHWSRRLPTNRTINPLYHGFASNNYVSMLLGLAGGPTQSLPVLDCLDNTSARSAFGAIRDRTATLHRTLPSHYEYLAALYASAETVPTARLTASAP